MKSNLQQQECLILEEKDKPLSIQLLFMIKMNNCVIKLVTVAVKASAYVAAQLLGGQQMKSDLTRRVH